MQVLLYMNSVGKVFVLLVLLVERHDSHSQALNMDSIPGIECINTQLVHRTFLKGKQTQAVHIALDASPTQ
ncbi:hypothetical protein GGS24DRAFT_483026 [Hypoxylon argillaceum]|nr:hypothetical protein GGS24DRAFT_483026 [Hypoxylon argillaceum]